MELTVGFANDLYNRKGEERLLPAPRSNAPRKSVVQVQFPGHGAALAYYNDRFDLRVGDFAYVDGALAGERGRVTDVNYNFKIKLSDYKRVIALVDTSVKGQFYFGGSHFVTFNRNAIPAEKVVRWFKAPAKDEEEFINGSDDSSFRLDDLKGMKIRPTIAERGYDYYMEGLHQHRRRLRLCDC